MLSDSNTVIADAAETVEQKENGAASNGNNYAEQFTLESKPLSKDTSKDITHDPSIPSISASAVLGESCSMPEGTPQVKGYDFNQGVHFDALMDGMATMGFQSTQLSRAIEEVRRMRSWRLSQVPIDTKSPFHSEELNDMSLREQIRAKIFLAFTSNQVSCGQREVLRFLVQHKMVDVVVTTAGGVEEDLIKCFHPTYIGSFHDKGHELRPKGINRIGNLQIPNSNYCDFESWIMPLLNRMHNEQDDAFREHAAKLYHSQQQQKAGHGESDEVSATPDFGWTPSTMIRRFGKEIDNEESILYWAYKNDIPIFCPALTDGSIGDMLYFHSYKRSGFVLDINRDMRLINDQAVQAYATGMILLGGGVVKHHTCNANLMRNGADFCVMINTAHEFDGSDAGASPDEAVSWGKIRMTANPVKVSAEATLVFPLLVSQTFAKNVEQWKKDTANTITYVAASE
jgi:deoxyhypusine synthase